MTLKSRWALLIGCAGLGGALSLRAADIPVPSVAHGQCADVVVDAASEASGFVVGGTLRKLGEGTLTLTNALFTGGQLEVAQSNVVLVSVAAAGEFPRPDWLFNDSNLALWVDASTNLIINNGRVDRWHDVREADTNAPTRLYAERWFDEPGPTLQTLDWLGSQTPFLEFGNMQSNGCWLSIMRPNANGTINSNFYISAQTFFAVRGTRAFNDSATNVHGFFFGGWDGNANNNGSRDFHVGSSTGSRGVLWNGEAVPYLQRAITSLDGRPVNGTLVWPNDWFQVVGLQLSAAWPLNNTVRFSNFFNDRNYHRPTTNYRQGGGQLTEVLVFTSALSESDRAAVEGYLLAKWIRRGQLGSVRVNANTSAELAVNTAESMTLGGLTGEGLISKTGDGDLRLRAFTHVPPRAMHLAAGSITVGPNVTRTDFPIDVPHAGQRLTVNNGVYALESLPDSAALTKTGNGTWLLTGIPSDTRTLGIEAGTLRLAPRLAATTGQPLAAIIPNATFEAWAGANYNYGPGLAGWTFEGQTSFDEGGGSMVDRGSGLARAVAGSPWIGTQTKMIDDGSAVAFIQRSGFCQTTVTLPEEGRYRLSFAHATRQSYVTNRHLLDVTFDSEVVARFESGPAAFVRRTILLPHRAAGTYTLRLQGIHLQPGDRTSLIDDLRVIRMPDDNLGNNLVPDGSFEMPIALAEALTPQTRFAEGVAVAHPAWTFSAPVIRDLVGNTNPTNYASAGIAQDTFGEWMLSTPDGSRCAFIFSDGRISVPLTFPTGGVYRLTFQGAGGNDNSKFSRNGYDITPNAQFPMTISLDGTNALSLTLPSPVFQAYDIQLPPVTNGQTATLTFAGTTATNGLTRIGLIDDVRVTYVGPVAFANAGFESGATGWHFTSAEQSGNGNVKSGTDASNGSWVNRVESGARTAYLQQTASISQTVAFAESGTHTVSFLAAARSEKRYSFAGHDFAVLWDGEPVGTVKTEEYLFTRYEFRLPHVAAGTHTLTFQGINTVGRDSASLIDDVRVARLAVEDAAYDPFPDGLTVEVVEGAILALDFAGVRPLHRLRVGGRLVSGLVSASSHPGAIAGAGALQVPNAGTLILLQ